MNSILKGALEDMVERIACRGEIPAELANADATIRMQQNQLLRIEKAQGFTGLAVKTGVVWLTGTPARGDVILHSADCHDFDGNWPFLIEALEAAEITLFRRGHGHLRR